MERLRPVLTRGQREVADRLADGWTYREIARDLRLSESAIQSTAATLRVLYDVRTAVALVFPLRTDGYGTDAVAPLRRPLTAREAEVLTLTGKGYTKVQAGVVLGISPNTVHSHLCNIAAAQDEGRRGALVAMMFEDRRRGEALSA
jgi:DNA-binding CsgD family transcriptional regulator